jgi:hypothetical protein
VSRTVWLALICLISLGVLFTLRSNIGARPMDGEADTFRAPSLNPAVADRPPLAKSDKLPSPYFDRPAAKAAGTIPTATAVVVEEATSPIAKQVTDLAPQARSETNEVTTWHWHAGSKITKRTTAVASGNSR